MGKFQFVANDDDDGDFDSWYLIPHECGTITRSFPSPLHLAPGMGLMDLATIYIYRVHQEYFQIKLKIIQG